MSFFGQKEYEVVFVEMGANTTVNVNLSYPIENLESLWLIHAQTRNSSAPVLRVEIKTPSGSMQIRPCLTNVAAAGECIFVPATQTAATAHSLAMYHPIPLLTATESVERCKLKFTINVTDTAGAAVTYNGFDLWFAAVKGPSSKHWATIPFHLRDPLAIEGTRTY